MKIHEIILGNERHIVVKVGVQKLESHKLTSEKEKNIFTNQNLQLERFLKIPIFTSVTLIKLN